MEAATKTNPETIKGTPVRIWLFLASSRLPGEASLVSRGVLFKVPIAFDPNIPDARKVPMNTYTVPSRKRILIKVVSEKRKKTRK